MKMLKSLKSWIVLATILVAGLPSLALGFDQIPLEGLSLSEDEMAETRGGLSLPGGGFLEFSMDYMRLQFVGNSDLGTPYGSAWVNSIKQRATITDEGIQFDMDILQGYSGEGSGEDVADSLGGNNLNTTQDPTGASLDPTNTTSGPLNSILAQNTLTGFSGLANTNLIAGNYNVGSIVNIFNIKVNFFSASDFNPVTSLGLVLH
jgi:hypothetical protein